MLCNQDAKEVEHVVNYFHKYANALLLDPLFLPLLVRPSLYFFTAIALRPLTLLRFSSAPKETITDELTDHVFADYSCVSGWNKNKTNKRNCKGLRRFTITIEHLCKARSGDEEVRALTE